MQTRDFMKPGRSVALASKAMAATSHPMATLAAVEILRAGGNAVDAAIAAMALQSVIDPHMTGIGGDCFALYSARGAAPLCLNGSGPAPAGADAAAMASRGAAIDDMSSDAVTVPGAVGAWAFLCERYGRLGLDRVLVPAIAAAEEGFVVAPRVAQDWSTYAHRLRRHVPAARQFLPGGRAPKAGERVANPALGRTLRAIAAGGARAFYEGAIAADIAATLRADGGTHSEADFSTYEPEETAPISAAYRGRRLVECPPNGQGLAALILARLIEGFDVAGMAEADRIHLLTEATKAAYRQRDLLISDPRRRPVPVEEVLSDAVIVRMRAGIAMDRAGPPADVVVPRHPDTAYVAVVDADGGAMSLINSNFHAFGSGIYAEASGVLLQSRGAGFSLDAKHPNVIAPGKRPFHTIIPAMLLKDDEPDMVFGVMGGQYQATGHAHMLMQTVDLGLDVQAASDAPRSFWEKGVLGLEPTVPDSVATDLAERGHEVHRVSEPIGGCQAIRIDREAGCLWGASDHRKDGIALGY